jgi:catecholate siderophore receptor
VSIASVKSRRSPVARPAFLALSCVGAFATSPAFASDDPVTPPTSDSDHDDLRQDVLVKGVREKKPVDPKQVAPLVDTPKSIVVLPSDVIQQTGSATLADALRTVPGITFGAAEGGNPIGDRPFIRGFDSQGSIFVDGVRDPASQTREVFATDSIEVVRGSDSALGGRGSAGGTINIISKLPQDHDFAELDASYGNGNYKRITGDANYKLTDTIAFRIEGMWHDQDVVDRDAIWQKRWGVAPSLTIGLGTPTRLTVAYYHLTTHELPDSGIPYLYVCSTTVCNAPKGTVYDQPAIGNVTLASGQTGYVDRSNFYGLVDRDFRDTTADQATIRVEHDFGGLTLRNTSRFEHNYQQYSFLLPDDSNGDVFGFTPTNGTVPNPVTDGTPLTDGGYVWRRANTRYGYDESLTNQTDLYGTFNTGSIKHSIAIGTEIDWEQSRRGSYVLATGSTITPRCDTTTLARYYCTSLFNPNPYDPWVNYTSDTSSTPTPIVKGGALTETQFDANTQSVYGFDSMTLLPQLVLNVGARYDHFGSSITSPPTTAGGATTTVSRNDDLFNWQAGLVFKPTHDTSIYASYATSATPPNSLLGEGSDSNSLIPSKGGAAISVDDLKVTKTKSYEVGAKANVLHDRLALSVAAFQTDTTNARVTDENGDVGYIGKTRIRGIEATFNGTIVKGWTVFGGYTYLDPVVTDGGFTALAVAANGAAPATTVNVVSVNTGKQVPQTAKNSFTLWTTVTPIHRLSIGGGAFYSGRQFGGYADNRYATQDASGVITVHPATTILERTIPGYWRFDARIGYELTHNISLSVNAQNLTNNTYFTQAYASHYATIAPGRTVFGTIGVKF